MTKTMLSIIKIGLGMLSVIVFFYRNFLSEQFSRLGPRQPDAIHVVLVNNHGTYSHITSSQDAQIFHLYLASGLLFFVAIAIDIFQRRTVK